MLALAVIGCGSRGPAAVRDPAAPTPLPNPPMKLEEGKVDNSLAGVYESEGSTLTLNRDGSYRMKTRASVKQRNGKRRDVLGEVSGYWSVKGDRLVLKQAKGLSGTYIFKREGNSLNLRSTKDSSGRDYRKVDQGS
jgi:hypothetical protein